MLNSQLTACLTRHASHGSFADLNTHDYALSDWQCRSCKQKAPSAAGAYRLISSDINRTGFEPQFFDTLSNLEDDNFWFVARNKLIAWAFQKYAPGASNFLEIGCGTGYVLQGMSRAFPELKLFGSELFHEGLEFARKRTPQATFLEMDARCAPFTRQFDSIGAFDVLEHIKEDEIVMSEVQRALAPAGIFLITVPQHRWLWGPSDDLSHHERRYTQNEMRTKLTKHGFDVLDMASFISLLLPAMLASRTIQQMRGQFFNELATTASLRPLHTVMSIERLLIKLGLRSPVGGSLLVVARKR